MLSRILIITASIMTLSGAAMAGGEGNGNPFPGPSVSVGGPIAMPQTGTAGVSRTMHRSRRAVSRPNARRYAPS